MNRLMLVVLLAALAGALWAQAAPPASDPAEELAAVLRSAAAIDFATVTGADLRQLMAEWSVPLQKAAYVGKARMASLMLPGAGEFKTGDPLGGSLFLLADIAVTAGALLGAYALLPANVRFDALDYWGGPIDTVRTRWSSNSVSAYLPSAAVLAGGALLSGALRVFSSMHAADLARRNISAGKVTFEPAANGVGMRWRW